MRQRKWFKGKPASSLAKYDLDKVKAHAVKLNNEIQQDLKKDKEIETLQKELGLEKRLRSVAKEEARLDLQSKMSRPSTSKSAAARKTKTKSRSRSRA